MDLGAASKPVHPVHLLLTQQHRPSPSVLEVRSQGSEVGWPVLSRRLSGLPALLRSRLCALPAVSSPLCPVV